MSIASPERLKAVGLWLIVMGLVAEAIMFLDAILFGALPPKLDKPLSVIFTLAIAAGVWIEYVGGNAIEAAKEKEAELAIAALKKTLATRQIKGDEFIKALEGKPKAPVEIMFVKDDAECFHLAMQVRDFLKMAKWEVEEPCFIIPPTDVARLSQYPSAMGAGGQPWGVTVVVRATSQADFVGKDADTPANALSAALLQSLGIIAGGTTFETGKPGVVRIVIAPKLEG